MTIEQKKAETVLAMDKEIERLKKALGEIKIEARSNVNSRPVVHDIAQQALESEAKK